MENQKSKKKRAVSSESNDVGSKRHELYKGVIGKINSAIEAGYYLEAITLEESLICDRFASRFTYLCKDKELEQKVEKKISSRTEFLFYDSWRYKIYCRRNRN